MIWKAIITFMVAFFMFVGIQTCSHSQTAQTIFAGIDKELKAEVVEEEAGDFTPADMVWKKIKGKNGEYQVFTYESNQGVFDFALIHYCQKHKAWEALLIVNGNFIPIGAFETEKIAKDVVEDIAWKVYNNTYGIKPQDT